MIKINSLKVEQLKELLRQQELSSSGQKAELVHRLSEALNSDEIYLPDETFEARSCDKEPCSTKMLQAQVNSLENMMRNLMSVVQTHASTVNSAEKILNEDAIAHVSNVRNTSTVISFENVRDIASLLPEFNPMIDASLNSIQFIRRIEMLKQAYKWSDDTLLFVVQQKLVGTAKLWVDSQNIFVTWEAFRESFLRDFPCEDNVASVHIRMSNMHRKLNETPQEYFYRMSSVGRKVDLREEDIAHHIINGINDNDLRKIISRNYVRLNDLLRDINTYCQYNSVRNDSHYNRTKNVEYNTAKYREFNNRNKNTINNNSESVILKVNEKRNGREIECFNCHRKGHLSINCPEPQRKTRCIHCQRTNHKSEQCLSKQSQEPQANVHKIVSEKPNTNFVKQICINGGEITSFVDSEVR